MKKIIVILSGGLDSTTLLYKLLKERNEVNAITFNYGQRHDKEIQAAIKTCKKLKVKHDIIDIKNITKFISNSALTSDIKVPEGHYQNENMIQTVVPSRNSIMAIIANGLAVNLNFDAIALGVHSGDHAIYPDCRPIFITFLQNLLSVNNYKNIEVIAPFLYKTKIEILDIGIQLGVDYSLTWTCYNGREKACGKCGACQERLEAFTLNNLKDPISYE